MVHLSSYRFKLKSLSTSLCFSSNVLCLFRATRTPQCPQLSCSLWPSWCPTVFQDALVFDNVSGSFALFSYNENGSAGFERCPREKGSSDPIRSTSWKSGEMTQLLRKCIHTASAGGGGDTHKLPAALNSRESHVLFCPVRVHLLTCEYLHIDTHVYN